MNTRINLHPSQFGEARKNLLESEAFTVSAWVNPSGVLAVDEYAHAEARVQGRSGQAVGAPAHLATQVHERAGGRRLELERDRRPRARQIDRAHEQTRARHVLQMTHALDTLGHEANRDARGEYASAGARRGVHAG